LFPNKTSHPWKRLRDFYKNGKKSIFTTPEDFAKKYHQTYVWIVPNFINDKSVRIHAKMFGTAPTTV